MTYLSIDEKVLNSVRDEGIEKSKEFLDEGEDTDEITLDGDLLESKTGDIEFDERTGCLSFSTELKIKKDNTSTDIGYFSDEIEIDLETASSIVNYFMKKLGKLKTVLEATKD